MTDNWLKDFAIAAVRDEKESGCPAELTVAQGILESGWGAHAPGNNCFGIKDYPGSFGRQSLMTTEFKNGRAVKIPQYFATFPTAYDCIRKHSQLITQNKRYQPAFAAYKTDGRLGALVHTIAPIYATDPDYANKITRVLASPKVIAALEFARNPAQSPS